MCRSAILLAALAGFGWIGIWPVREAIADYWFQKGTVAATRRAIAVTPDQSECSVREAVLIGDDKPAEAIAALRRAVTLNPCDGRAWIELGLRLEATGDLAGAERALLRAAEEDKMYQPRWTLMNYYYRRERPDRVWYWAKAAAPMLYGTPIAFFQLCGRVQEDGMLLKRLEIREPEMQAAYVSYLQDHGLVELSGPASGCVLARNRAEDVPLLLDTWDRLLERGRIPEAKGIWDGLCRSHRLPFAAGAGIVNGDFAVSPTGRGFDWRMASLEGIEAAREVGPAGLRLTFSGEESEQLELLSQFVPVEPGATYELQYVARTEGIEHGDGLSWEIGSGKVTAGDDVASEEPATHRLVFAAPPGNRVVRLSLTYRRPPGRKRLRGSLVLRGVTCAKKAG